MQPMKQYHATDARSANRAIGMIHSALHTTRSKVTSVRLLYPKEEPNYIPVLYSAALFNTALYDKRLQHGLHS
jgi:hypothetical protein